MFFGVALHKLVVHFPVPLAVAACGYDLWAVYAGRPGLHAVGSGLLRLSALAAIVAAATGLGQASMSGLGSLSSVTGHAGMALLGTGLLLALAGLRYSREARSAGAETAPGSALILAEAIGVFLAAAATVMGHRI
jgi:uncharacterized membrane protein